MERIKKKKTRQKVFYNKIKTKSLACLLMVVTLFVSLQPVKTDALAINGAGTGVVVGTGNATGDYGYRSADALLGFRATLVNSLGTTVNGTRPIDIYSSSLQTNTLNRFTTKYSKAELILLYETLQFPLTTTSSTTVYGTDTISATSWGLSIPASAAKMVDWATAVNMRTLLEKAWGSDTNELSANGWAVMMEPIYELKIKNNWFALTPTEMAIVAVADGSGYKSPTNYWDDALGWSSSNTDINTWKYISGYTHGAWPQALRLTSAQAGIAAPSATLSKSSRGTSRQIVKEGYGVMLVYSENLGDYLVNYNGNGATSGSMVASPATHNKPFITRANAFQKTGHIFNGWNEERDGSGASWQLTSAGVYESGKTWNYAYQKGITLYAQWKPAEYTVTYNGNGGVADAGYTSWSEQVAFGSNYKTWPNKEGNNTEWYERTGYTFTGWNTKADGTGDDWTPWIGKDWTWNYTWNVTLYAQWKPNEYKITYDANGGKYEDANTSYTSWSEAVTYGKNYKTWPNKTTIGNDWYKRTGYTFEGWNEKADGSGTDWTPWIGKDWTWSYTRDVTLYAQWVPLDDDGDEGPRIEAEDRWFMLTDAKNGVITLDELMSTASADDSTVGEYTDFAAGKGTFTIIDYDKNDFSSFEAAGSVTVTYKAVDLAGNTTYKTVTVHIVDENLSTPSTSNTAIEKREIRFISEKYYRDVSGGFVDAESGGLNAYSRWVTSRSYMDVLMNALENNNNNGDWTIAPLYSFNLDSEAIGSLKSFIETNGIGNSLSLFFNDYLNQTQE